MGLDYRFATELDIEFLAQWNHQLIRDEGHRNEMSVPELKERMREWLESEYAAVIFSDGGMPVAYALYRESEQEVYLRQFFVIRDLRRQGIGREAVRILRQKIWPKTKRLTVEVLTANNSAVNFWREVGYKDYCLTLEVMPQEPK